MKKYPATNKLVPQSRGLGYFAVSGLRDETFHLVAQCMHQLRSLGVVFDEVHTEGCRGQYELALSPLPSMKAIDQLVLVQDTLKDVFFRNGYVVIMSPKPVAGPDGEVNGQHMHVSLPPDRPGIEAHVLAGILGRLPSLCAFWLPQDLSYERRQPYSPETPSGTESRLVPIRKSKPGH